MSWLTPSQEGDICPVCIEIFDDPIELPCAAGPHSFCLSCIDSLIKSGDERLYIVCPMCYEEVDVKSGEEAYGLKRNESLALSSEKKKDQLDELQSYTTIDPKILKALEQVESAVAPRSIKLLEEYELSIGQSGKTNIPDAHMGMIMYGADKDKAPEETEDYANLTYWRGILIGPQDSPIGAVIYNVVITVPEKYPVEPPQIRFRGPQIVMEAVDPKGHVDLSKIERVDVSQVGEDGTVQQGKGEKFAWNPQLDIIDALVAIRENMHIQSVCAASGSAGEYPADPEE